MRVHVFKFIIVASRGLGLGITHIVFPAYRVTLLGLTETYYFLTSMKPG